MTIECTPRIVATVLETRWTWFFARLLMVSAYLYSALTKSMHFPAAVAEQAHLGLQPAVFFAALTIAVEVVGPVLILSGRLVWLGAGMLGVFTALTIIVAHAFWRMPVGAQRFQETNSFYEHLGLVAGFVLIAIVAHRQDRSSTP